MKEVEGKTIIWNSSRASDLELTPPHVTTYQSNSIKGYNLLIKQPDIRFLVFEGGGAKGVAYVGVMESLQQRGMLDKVESVGGSSAGALQAMLFSMGYSTQEMHDILLKTDMSSFLDIAADQSSMNWIQKRWRQLLNITTKTEKLGRGVYQGDTLKNWLRDQVRSRIQSLYNTSSGANREYLKTLVDKDGEVTFRDLEILRTKIPEAQIKTPHFTGTNITKPSLEVFNSTTRPDMPVYLAARISASFPWAFRSVIYDGNEYIDGGVLNNYPMQIFDNPDNEKYCIGEGGANLEALGVRVDSEQEIRDLLWKTPDPEHKGFLHDFKTSLSKFFVGADFITAGKASDVATYEKYPHRTIQVSDNGTDTLNFNLSEQDKQDLVSSGQTSTETYLDNYFSDETAISVPVENLEALSDYVSKETLKAAAERFGAELYIQTDLPNLMADLPFEYFQQEMQNTIKKETKKLLDEQGPTDVKLLEQAVIPKVHERLYALLESSLKTQFDQALTKGGYEPKAFPEVIFDVLQFTDSSSPVNRIVSNIANITDSNGDSYLQNVINNEITSKKLHDLSQSADELQSKIDQYDLDIAASKKEKQELELKIDSIEKKIDSVEQQEKERLIEQRTNLERQIDVERVNIERKEADRAEAKKEKERRESSDWDIEKESERQMYEKDMQEYQKKANNQRDDIFSFKE
jgi:NTE family protein